MLDGLVACHEIITFIRAVRTDIPLVVVNAAGAVQVVCIVDELLVDIHPIVFPGTGFNH